MADALFEVPRLAAIYDIVDGDRFDLAVYAAIVAELGARSVLDVGCGTGRRSATHPTAQARKWCSSRGAPDAIASRGSQRLLTRQTSRWPDQSSSIAATFTSTRPSSRACARTTLSVISLSCPPARRGHAAQIPPFG